MCSIIMQNIFSNIQQHDVLAMPVSFSCTMSSFNDFDCMKTVADMKFLWREFPWEWLIFFCLLIFVAYDPRGRQISGDMFLSPIWGDNLHQGYVLAIIVPHFSLSVLMSSKLFGLCKWRVVLINNVTSCTSPRNSPNKPSLLDIIY